MKNTFEIIWTNEAKSRLDSIHEYLAHNWSVKEVAGFYDKLEKKIGMISKNPYYFVTSTIKKTIKRCVVTDQVSIIFEIDDNRIVILALIDNRINPKVN